MKWEDLRGLRMGVKITNKPALNFNENELIFIAEFVVYDRNRDEVILRYNTNQFTTVKEYQSKYWEKKK